MRPNAPHVGRDPFVALAVSASFLFSAHAALADERAAELARGEAVYGRCLGCHAIDFDGAGPRHRGLFGRVAGTLPGFDYSTAMKESGIVWDAETLDAFLAAPRDIVPGTRMTYAGVADPQERADLIAYLEQATAE